MVRKRMLTFIIKSIIIKKAIKKILTGLTLPQEYVCIDKALFQSPLSVLLHINNHVFDVTESHLFLGYKPLIIGIVTKKATKEFDLLSGSSLCLLDFMSNENGARVATVSLKKIKKLPTDDNGIFLFEGVEGHHSFLNGFHQWMHRQRRRISQDQPGNVGLPGNLYDQVRIAYSVPRVISVVTVSDGVLINLFPTDLHGPAGDKFYLSSLRINGKANEQVETYKEVVISEINPGFCKEIYSLGKNHMKDLRPLEQFKLRSERSKVLDFPLPIGALRYRELRQVHSVDHGIHRIHVYRTINETDEARNQSTLAHIHQYYAQWRINQKLKNHFLIR
jgi:flavin reductase (DIM6/NTAB) family NADH-FMN oxidoreductase RutF